MVSELALALLTVLGAAGEALGSDRRPKTNTDRRRMLTLMYQAARYAALPWTDATRATALLERRPDWRAGDPHGMTGVVVRNEGMAQGEALRDPLIAAPGGGGTPFLDRAGGRR